MAIRSANVILQRYTCGPPNALVQHVIMNITKYMFIIIAVLVAHNILYSTKETKGAAIYNCL